MTTVVTGDAKAARDKRRRELLDTLLAFGGTDAETLRVIIKELVEELPTPSLEMAVEHITAKRDALETTVTAEDGLDETVMAIKDK